MKRTTVNQMIEYLTTAVTADPTIGKRPVAVAIAKRDQDPVKRTSVFVSGIHMGKSRMLIETEPNVSVRKIAINRKAFNNFRGMPIPVIETNKKIVRFILLGGSLTEAAKAMNMTVTQVRTILFRVVMKINPPLFFSLCCGTNRPMICDLQDNADEFLDDLESHGMPKPDSSKDKAQDDSSGCV